MRTNKSPPTAQDMQLAVAVYERHKGMMLKTAMENYGDHSLAEDIVHDAMLRLAEYAGRLRVMSAGEQARYTKLVVRSVAVDYKRRFHHELRYIAQEDGELLAEFPADGLLEDDFIEQDTRSRRLGYLFEALGEMRGAEREALVGKYLLGESNEALAARLGMKPGSVRTLLTRAHRSARRIIERKESGHAKK